MDTMTKNLYYEDLPQLNLGLSSSMLYALQPIFELAHNEVFLQQMDGGKDGVLRRE